MINFRELRKVIKIKEKKQAVFKCRFHQIYRIQTPNIWIKSLNFSKTVKKPRCQNVTFSKKTNFEFPSSGVWRNACKEHHFKEHYNKEHFPESFAYVYYRKKTYQNKIFRISVFRLLFSFLLSASHRHEKPGNRALSLISTLSQVSKRARKRAEKEEAKQ